MIEQAKKDVKWLLLKDINKHKEHFAVYSARPSFLWSSFKAAKQKQQKKT